MDDDRTDERQRDQAWREQTPLRFLVVESETAEQREERRRSAGKSAGESYAATLRQMVPGCAVEQTIPSDPEAAPWSAAALAAVDAVFLSGSPLHAYCATPETERQIAFMRTVFASGTPSFGSCAGLQVATVAAGGQVRPMRERREAGLARGLTATAAGRDHPLLAGRPPAWDAFAIHGDEVETLPPGATLLATNAAARVQAAEIRCGNGTFWGVQYHPELAPGEIAAALRREADGLVEAGLGRSPADIEAEATLFDDLHHAPDDRAVRWRLGIDAEVADEPRRRTEIANFLRHLVEPIRRRRREGGQAAIAG